MVLSLLLEHASLGHASHAHATRCLAGLCLTTVPLGLLGIVTGWRGALLLLGLLCSPRGTLLTLVLRCGWWVATLRLLGLLCSPRGTLLRLLGLLKPATFKALDLLLQLSCLGQEPLNFLLGTTGQVLNDRWVTLSNDGVVVLDGIVHSLCHGLLRWHTLPIHHQLDDGEGELDQFCKVLTLPTVHRHQVENRGA